MSNATNAPTGRDIDTFFRKNPRFERRIFDMARAACSTPFADGGLVVIHKPDIDRTMVSTRAALLEVVPEGDGLHKYLVESPRELIPGCASFTFILVLNEEQPRLVTGQLAPEDFGHDLLRRSCV